jgi:hypothetical protein
MSTLYTIASQYRADLALLADLDIDAQTVADTIEGMGGELEDKLRAVIAWSMGQSVLAQGTKEAADKMYALAKSRQARCDATMQCALDAMLACNIREISTEEFSAKPAKKPASVNVTNTAALPAEFWRTPEPPLPMPDKAAIAAALKLGRDVPGATLVQGYRLAVR